ncbi:hypothetical protein Pmani_024170 [Petrolisthes manimaculis]|uniref:Uncharacterized protein n=1 Tax=Petrolisthes manimaculis TaxID=1843537 RepID=A0AAE1P8D1_9EUCA|nr:hypothetical protein Pmani_024170 [Petrolisthes manimaculis]
MLVAKCLDIIFNHINSTQLYSVPPPHPATPNPSICALQPTLSLPNHLKSTHLTLSRLKPPNITSLPSTHSQPHLTHPPLNLTQPHSYPHSTPIPTLTPPQPYPHSTPSPTLTPLPCNSYPSSSPPRPYTQDNQ